MEKLNIVWIVCIVSLLSIVSIQQIQTQELTEELAIVEQHYEWAMEMAHMGIEEKQNVIKAIPQLRDNSI